MSPEDARLDLALKILSGEIGADQLNPSDWDLLGTGRNWSHAHADELTERARAILIEDRRRVDDLLKQVLGRLLRLEGYA